MTAGFDIRYARSGDLHIAYEVLDTNGPGGVDVLRIAAFVSNLEHSHALPRFDEGSHRLARLGRVISYDNRGTGLSDRLRTARLPSIEERMDDLRAVLDAAGSERAALACFSDGGPLGCLFAATYPDRTVALVLCNTAPRFAWAPDYPWGIRAEDFERELAELERGWGRARTPRRRSERRPGRA
jgi:pimeloyl-ACP methyl ester carboxylesterase